MNSLYQPPEYLSKHFSYAEGIISDTASRLGINNTPPQDTVAVMISAAQNLERVRDYLSTPMHINSWYRSLDLNRALKSLDTSQHIRGEAIDFISPAYGTSAVIAKRLVAAANIIQFDQLILEHTWVHISFAILSGKPRNQVLSLVTGGHYVNGLTDSMGNPIK